jgi:putative oxidoreductase
MNALFETYGGWAAFALRIALGVVFFAHGAQLALGWFGGHGFKNAIAASSP